MTSPVVLDSTQISKYLPHGTEMLLVDEVATIDPGVSIVGTKTIKATELCYKGVPSGPVLDRCAYPVSLLIESFGQTAALLWLYNGQQLATGSDQVLMFVSARELCILDSAFPGDVLRHHARLDKQLSDTIFVSGEIWVEDRKIASIGSMIAVVRSQSSLLTTSHSTEQVKLPRSSNFDPVPSVLG